MISKPAIRKTRSKRRHQIKPVNRLLNHCKHILSMLINNNKGKNEIFNRLKQLEDPGLNYKYDTLDAIHHLKKGGLIKQSENIDKPHKDILELTELGSELSRLIYFVDGYERNYRKLREKIKYHFDITSDKRGISQNIARSRLEQRGWKAQEITQYNSLYEGILSLEAHLPLVILTALLSRYLKIIYYYKPLNNISKEILRKVIMDAITANILDRLEGILADKIFSKKSEEENAFELTYRLFSGWTISHFRNHVDTYSENRFIENESLDLLKTLYNILNPEVNFLLTVLERPDRSNPKINRLIKVLEASKNISGKS